MQQKLPFPAAVYSLAAAAELVVDSVGGLCSVGLPRNVAHGTGVENKTYFLLSICTAYHLTSELHKWPWLSVEPFAKQASSISDVSAPQVHAPCNSPPRV